MTMNRTGVVMDKMREGDHYLIIVHPRNSPETRMFQKVEHRETFCIGDLINIEYDPVDSGPGPYVRCTPLDNR